MAMLADTSLHPRAPNAGFEFSFPYRQFERPEGGGGNTSQRLDFTVTLTPHGCRETGPAIGIRAGAQETASLRAAVAFLVDATYGTVTAATLAQMIGCYFFTTGAAPGVGMVTVSLASTHGDSATAQAARPSFEVERTGFGAAHILHEDDALGLYILEIAPHGTIPAHCHQVMRESELILDDGLLQQDRPVARGSAFAWPLGHIHAYRNPTGRPRRILCVDSPHFMPEDEVPLAAAPRLVPLAAAPRLVPLAPLVNYLA